jgi:hypothetical protein
MQGLLTGTSIRPLKVSLSATKRKALTKMALELDWQDMPKKAAVDE